MAPLLRPSQPLTGVPANSLITTAKCPKPCLIMPHLMFYRESCAHFHAGSRESFFLRFISRRLKPHLYDHTSQDPIRAWTSCFFAAYPRGLVVFSRDHAAAERSPAAEMQAPGRVMFDSAGPPGHTPFCSSRFMAPAEDSGDPQVGHLMSNPPL